MLGVRVFVIVTDGVPLREAVRELVVVILGVPDLLDVRVCVSVTDGVAVRETVCEVVDVKENP